MSLNIVAAVMQYLAPEVIVKIAGSLGIDRAIALKAVSAMVPAILAAIAGKASTADGARAVSAAFAEQDPELLGGLSGVLGGPNEGALIDYGTQMTQTLIGSTHQDALIGAISKHAGLADKQTKSLMGVIAPVVSGTLARYQHDNSLDADGIAKFLISQKELFATALPAGMAAQMMPAVAAPTTKPVEAVVPMGSASGTAGAAVAANVAAKVDDALKSDVASAVGAAVAGRASDIAGGIAAASAAAAAAASATMQPTVAGMSDATKLKSAVSEAVKAPVETVAEALKDIATKAGSGPAEPPRPPPGLAPTGVKDTAAKAGVGTVEASRPAVSAPVAVAAATPSTPLSVKQPAESAASAAPVAAAPKIDTALRPIAAAKAPIAPTPTAAAAAASTTPLKNAAAAAGTKPAHASHHVAPAHPGTAIKEPSKPAAIPHKSEAVAAKEHHKPAHMPPVETATQRRRGLPFAAWLLPLVLFAAGGAWWLKDRGDRTRTTQVVEQVRTAADEKLKAETAARVKVEAEAAEAKKAAEAAAAAAKTAADAAARQKADADAANAAAAKLAADAEAARRKAEADAATKVAVVPDVTPTPKVDVDAAAKVAADAAAAKAALELEARRKADAEAAAAKAATEADGRRKAEADAAAAIAAKAAAAAEATRKAEADAAAAKLAAAAAEAKTKAELLACQSSVRDAATAARVQFEFASATLKKDGVLTLAKLAETLKACPSVGLRIEGHTDNNGDVTRNQRLSESRAKSVVEALAVAGIQGNRLAAIGLGQTKPLAPNDNERNRARNRRIEFVVE